MKLNFKRLMAMFLSVIMVVGMMPTMVFANEIDLNDSDLFDQLNGIINGSDNADITLGYPAGVYTTNGDGGRDYASYETVDAALAAAQNGDEVAIHTAGTYSLAGISGKNITVTGTVDGVVFDNIGSFGMNGANVTFTNVTFDYYPNVNYTGLQHSGNLVYNNCTFNGQVFLYGVSETFNTCKFNQNSADAYNVWTYGAKEVAFDNCTFNSAGKSVLVYNESATAFTDLAVANTTFNASAAVDGKAAIEIDTSLSAGASITVDAATTATGFGTGSVSGNSLWNNKKGSEGDNNDITIVVGDTTVLSPAPPVTYVAYIGTQGYESLDAAFAAAQNGETVELIADTYENIVIPAEFGGTLAIGTCKLNSITNNSATAKIVINGAVVVENANGSAITGEVINISGNGTLTANANGDHAHGIGGDNTKSITIENVHILNVQGGHYGEIGTDTKYYKDAPEGGAAIGSGSNGAVITLKNVNIDKALGGSKAAGIGARYHTGVTINITGCNIARVEGGATAAAIGGSRVSNGATESEAVTINIQNSSITAVGGVYAAGIGSGYDTHCQANQPICTIKIDGSTINATGGKYAAGIGTGYHNAGLAGEIKNSTITATSGDKVYKDEYTSAQDIGFGVSNLEKEGSNNNSCVIYNGTKIALPGNVAQNVAQIGTVGYKSLDDAFAAAQAGDTIVLLTDVRVASATVEAGNITIDLNGCTITGADNVTDGDLAIMGTASLTITDSSNPSNGKFDGVVLNRGTLTIESGTVTSDSCDSYGIGGTIICQPDDQGNLPKLNITGGTVSYTGEAVLGMAISASNTDRRVSELNISGGTITSTRVCVFAEATGTISGGTFRGNDLDDYFTNVRLTYGATITGGTYNTDVSDYVAEGYKQDEKGNVIQSAPAVTYVAYIGTQGYESLQAAITAAQAGDTIVIGGDITSNSLVVIDVNKNLTITGNGMQRTTGATLTNIGINAVVGCDELTVSNLTFAGNSWINSGAASKLTVSGVTANVTPNNSGYTNSRSAFISLGKNEGQELELVVENSNIVAKDGADPILGWAAITKATTTGNTFGSADEHQKNSDSVKFMAIANGATLNFEGNTVYSDYNGIVLGQNTTRGNAYTATFTNNTFIGNADHIWIEVSGSNKCNGNVNAKSDNTINGNIFTVNDIKVHPYLNTYTGYMGVDVELDAEGKVIGGTMKFASDGTLADGYELDENGKVVQSAPPVTYVAYIGAQGYASLAEALEAAKNMTGDVVVEIHDKVTLNAPFNGAYDSITFVGKDTDAEIYLDVQGYVEATGEKVAFVNLILSKAEGGYITNAGFMNLAFGIFGAEEVTYANCKFANGAYASSGDVTFTDCTFKRSYDKYGLWAYGNVDVTVDGCTFADYRGIKMYAEGKAKTGNLTVKGTDFSAVDNKPAIVLTYGASVTLENNTYSSTGVFELDLDGEPNGVAVTSDVAPTCVNDNGACGVLVDGKIYTTVAQAAEVATSGSTVTLLHNSSETVELAEGVILDKNGYTADGVTVHESIIAPAVVEVKTYEELIAALAGNVKSIKMMNDITATATQNSGYGVAGIVINAGYVLDGNGKTLTINGANATWDCAIAMKGGEVKNLTIAGAMRGVFMPGANGDVVIDNCVFENVIYTFNSDAGSKDYTVTIKNTTLNGWTSFSDVHKSVTFENCSFGKGSGYQRCRPYQATTFTNCSFGEGFEFDTTAAKDKNLAFNGCTYNGTALSAKNNAMFYNGGKVIIDGVSTDVTPPTGSNSPAYTTEVDGYVRVWGEGRGNAKESFVLKLYSDDTLIATTTLNNVGGIIDGDVYATWHFFYPASNDVYWTTTWEEGHPNSAAQPTKVELYIDGTRVAITDAKMSGADGINPVEWAELGGVKKIVTGLSGTGTAEDPYLINDLEELKWFRDNVNTYTQDGSNQYKGKYVKLTADIDLAGITWEPIGKNAQGDHQNFLGHFDGNGKTISNLTIEGTDHLGFFANVGAGGDGTPASVKNLTFNNVKISGTGNYVGTVIANGHATTTVENVHVTGTIDISGRGYIGGIVGHAYVKMNNVSVIGTGTISSTFWCAGGILGYAGEGATNIMNAHVEGITITSAAGGLGAIVGMAEDNNGTQPISGSNLSAKNVAIKTYTGAYGDAYANYALGYLYGGNPTSKLTGKLTVENVTVETSTGETPTIVDAVASVNGTIYFDLQSAVNAAQAGETVKLIKNVTLTNTLTILADKNIILDLNGKTISQSKTCTASYSMIENKGGLTITGKGKISFTDTGAGDPNFGWGSYTIHNSGNLVVENGTIEFKGNQAFATHCSLAIFQYSGSTTINGGSIVNNAYRSVRLWKGDMTINGGDFQGQVWVHCVDNSAKLTIKGGAFAPALNGGDGSSVFVNNSGCTAELTVTGGIFNTKIGANDVEALSGAITGGLFTEAAKNGTNTALLGNNTFSDEVNEDGYYTVAHKAIEVTYANGTVEYFDDILKAVEEKTNNDKLEGATIKLLGDYTGSGIRFYEHNMILDLNGHTYTINRGTGSSGTKNQCFQVRSEAANIVIKNGSIRIAEKAERVENVDIYWVFNGYCDYTLENVTVDCTNLDAATTNYVVLTRGAAQLTGATSIVNFNGNGPSVAATTAGSVVIDTTGTIEGGIESDGYVELKSGTVTGALVLSNAAATLKGPEDLNVTTTVDGYEVEYAGGKYALAKVEAPVLSGSIRIRNVTLNLLDKVCIIYKATDDNVATNDTNVVERGILLFDSAEKAASKDIAQAYEMVILEWDENEAKYIGQTEGIDARDMDKSQFAVAYVKMTDGTYIFGTKEGTEQILEYSPLIYCKNMQNNDVVGALCAAMMHYGAAAQVLQYGKTTGLMNEGFAAVAYDATVLGETVYSANGDPVNGMELKAVTMDLQGAISYIAKYVADDSLEGKKLYAEYTLLGKTGSVELVEGNDGRLWAVINGVAPKDLGATLTVKPYYLNENGQKVYGGELVYSGYEYVRRTLNNTNSSEALKDLCEALAMFIYYADNFGNN